MIMRRAPRFRTYSAYGDDASSVITAIGQSAAAIGKAVSPWDMLTGIFVAKPIAEQQTAAQLQEAQIQAAVAQQQNQAKTIRTVIYVGAGLVGVIILAVALKPRSPPPQALKS